MSPERWAAVWRDVNRPGQRAPKRTVSDDHLGIWTAFAAGYPVRAVQRCGNHTLRKVLDTVAKQHQAELKAARA